MAKAAKQGVKVIAYDRLLMNTPDVDRYVTFDNTPGRRSRSKVHHRKARSDTGAESVQPRDFLRLSDDNNSYYFYDGDRAAPALHRRG
ncbi:MAG: hypothetical protein ACLUI3_06220 [Christensenellales bacterium]